MNIEELEIKNEDWKEKIQESFDRVKELMQGFVFPCNITELFLDEIWKQSTEAFDKPREIQVLIDAKDDLYISVGTPSFVSFENQEDGLDGMQLPYKCWIHTHPFGSAYFSATDWSTINTWKTLMESAIVLGDREYLAYRCNDGLSKKCYLGFYEQPAKPEWVNAAEDVLDGEEE